MLLAASALFAQFNTQAMDQGESEIPLDKIDSTYVRFGRCILKVAPLSSTPKLLSYLVLDG